MKISKDRKLSKVQSIIVFTILVSLAMSGIMSFGLLLTRIGWQPDFLKIWFFKYFLVECRFRTMLTHRSVLC